MNSRTSISGSSDSTRATDAAPSLSCSAMAKAMRRARSHSGENASEHTSPCRAHSGTVAVRTPARARRSVSGPALPKDGPQLSARWSCREFTGIRVPRAEVVVLARADERPAVGGEAGDARRKDGEALHAQRAPLHRAPRREPPDPDAFVVARYR